jgi:hypothetical protein
MSELIIPVYTKGKAEVTHVSAAPENASILPEAVQPIVLPKGNATATAKTAKVSIVLDPASLTRVSSEGKKQTKLIVTVGTMKFDATVNSKSYRKALATLDELGVDGCSIILQAAMTTMGKLESCGLAVQPKAPKVVVEKEPESDGE